MGDVAHLRRQIPLTEVERRPVIDEILQLAQRLREEFPEADDAAVAELALAATNLGFVLGGLVEAATQADADHSLAAPPPAPTPPPADRLIDIVQDERPVVTWWPTFLRFYFNWSWFRGR